MGRRHVSTLFLVCGIALLACAPEVGDLATQPERADALSASRADFEWSEPVWLGDVVNSPSRDLRPVLSPDGHRLYFHSDRPGGVGGVDIWVSSRSSPNCPWEAPVNLGAPVNTTGDDGDVAFTPDGRTLFFSSTGHGGAGAGDLYISRREHSSDEFAWQTPVNLGVAVNTTAHESTPAYVPQEDGGTLYFGRGGANPSTGDIYRVPLTRDGEPRGAPALVAELSAPTPIGDGAPTVSNNGKEIIFWSGGAAGTRPGAVGLADYWVSTRQSVDEPWSEPRNLGAPVNSAFAELTPSLSHNGNVLFFSSGRPGGLGLLDMWMSTRRPGNGTEPEGPGSLGCK